jgi:anti-anti-sigma factor
MSMSPTNVKSASIEKSFRLPEVVDADAAETLTEKFQECLSEPGVTLTLDASQVEIILSAGVQLILSINYTLEQSGGRLVVAQPSEIFVQMFKALGLLSQLEQWSRQ